MRILTDPVFTSGVILKNKTKKTNNVSVISPDQLEQMPAGKTYRHVPVVLK